MSNSIEMQTSSLLQSSREMNSSRDIADDNNHSHNNDHEPSNERKTEKENLLVNSPSSHQNNNNHTSSNPSHDATNALAANVRISATIAPSGVDFCGIHIPMKVGMLIGTSFIVLGGIALGLGLNSPVSEHSGGELISAIMGWWYFLAWSVSFFPQIYINYRRKSCIGQSFDYLFLNLLGFASYTVFNVCFFFSDEIKQEYADRFNSKNEVQINDVGFAVMALILTTYNIWQAFTYERGGQVLTKPVYYFMMLSVVFGCVWALILCFGVRTKVFFNPLDLLYGLSMLKLAISVYKYIPQIYLNYSRKTTAGWNIYNVLLDFTGGSLSVAQELMDAQRNDTWSALAGNAAKFGLGSFSVIYDIIMMIQHYCLYAENNRKLAAMYEQNQSGSGGDENKNENETGDNEVRQKRQAGDV